MIRKGIMILNSGMVLVQILANL